MRPESSTNRARRATEGEMGLEPEIDEDKSRKGTPLDVMTHKLKGGLIRG